jgi:S-adenosylmethionine decarboxylase
MTHHEIAPKTLLALLPILYTLYIAYGIGLRLSTLPIADICYPILEELAMQHLMLDLYGCSAELLEDAPFLRQVLDEYPGLIGMEKVSPVELRYITTCDPRDAGYSGFVIIATSHVSLHAWSAYGMVNMDIFSCEVFDQEAVIRFAMTKFQTGDMEVHRVERATRSPRRSVFRAGSSLRREMFESGLWHRELLGLKGSSEIPSSMF